MEDDMPNVFHHIFFPCAPVPGIPGKILRLGDGTFEVRNASNAKQRRETPSKCWSRAHIWKIVKPLMILGKSINSNLFPLDFLDVYSLNTGNMVAWGCLSGFCTSL